MYAVVTVTGGGVFIKRKDNPVFDSPLHPHMKTEVDPESPFGNHRVRLVQPSAVRGLLMRLCGMASPVRLFEEAEEGSEAKRILRAVEGLAARARIVETKAPFLETVFFDAFNEAGQRKDNPNVDLSNISWAEAHPIVRFLQKELSEALGAKTVLGCYDAIQAAAKLKEASCCQLPADAFAGIDMTALTENKLALKFVSTLEKQQAKYDMVFAPLLKIARLCVARLASDAEYRAASEAAGTQVSNFTQTAPQTKPWADVLMVQKVLGVPEYVAKTNWRMIIPRLTEAEAALLDRGPMSATWGENGTSRLRIEYVGDAIEGESDTPHVTVRAMNKIGFKIKTTDAEKEARAQELKGKAVGKKPRK